MQRSILRKDIQHQSHKKIEMVGDNVIYYIGTISMMGEEIYRTTGFGNGGRILSVNDVKEKVNKFSYVCHQFCAKWRYYF